MSPEPKYTPQEVPFIKKNRNRLPNIRAKQLLRAAERAHNDPPPPPGLGECCGSSCDPCVSDLWNEELAVWRERWGDGAVEGGPECEPEPEAGSESKTGSGSESGSDKKGGEGAEDGEGDGCKFKMPGGWEW